MLFLLSEIAENENQLAHERGPQLSHQKQKKNANKHIRLNRCKNRDPVAEKTCRFCSKEFYKKSNCDRHIRDVHYLETHSNNVSVEVEEDLVDNFETPSNVSDDEDLVDNFPPSNGSDNEDLVENFEPLSNVSDEEDLMQDLELDANISFERSSVNKENEFNVYIINGHEEEVEDAPGGEDLEYSNETGLNEEEENIQPHSDEELRSSNTCDNEKEEASRNDESESSDEEELNLNLESFLQEITSKVNVKNYEQEEKFIPRVLTYIEKKLKSRDKHAMQLLDECFGDLTNDCVFMTWLARNLDMKTMRLREIISKYGTETSEDTAEQETPGRPFTSIGKDIYEFWKNNSTVSNDRCNSRDIVCIAKTEYLKDFKHVMEFEDEDLSEEQVTFKKTSNKKTWVKSSRRIYTKPSRDLYMDFLDKYEVSICFSTFYKYKPFYVTSPTEREKDCCVCIRCLNIHLLLKAINSYRKRNQGLTKHPSATRLLKDLFTAISENDEEISEKYPEYMDNKVTSFYQFRKTQEKYFNKNCEEKVYTRTSRVDSKLPISEITKLFMGYMDVYLLHRKSVDNDRLVWPLYKNNFDGKFFHLDFSKNISLVEKHQVQEAGYSGKQYTLHCAWMDTPSPQKYIYHLSDDTNHDPAMLDEVLRDIFNQDETVLMKSDNAPQQYKNKYFFAKVQGLADDYNAKIIYVYGASGHGKGLVDSMSSFGVKNILRCSIVGTDAWWKNSEEMCEFLRAREDPRICYIVIFQPVRATRTGRKRQNWFYINVQRCIFSSTRQVLQNQQ